MAPGFLQRRCYVGVTTPGGYECIGGFGRDARGLWHATIDMPYNDVRDSDSLEVGGFKKRLDAIVALWGSTTGAVDETARALQKGATWQLPRIL